MAIAKASGVCTPTLYRWWSSKADAAIASSSDPIRLRRASSRAEARRAQVRALVRLNGRPTGQVVTDIIREGRADLATVEAVRAP